MRQGFCFRNSKVLFLFTFLFFAVPRYVFSQDSSDDYWDEPAPGETSDILMHGLIGSAETLMSNGILMLFNAYALRVWWALPTEESIRESFAGNWQWESKDHFTVNQIGHPFQGSLYFSSGRVNGFGFYESFFFSGLGSFTWEALGEANTSAINDFVVTVTGSLSIGEMLYRLYLEARELNVPTPFLAVINPIAVFHSYVTGWEPPKTGGNLYEFRAFAGVSYTDIASSISPGDEDVFGFSGFYGDIGFKVVYGNPYEQDTRIPFRQFDLAFTAGINPGAFNELRVISDGYLFSFSPVYSEANKLSTGLSLQFDFVSLGKYGPAKDSTIDQSSIALDWTFKYLRLFFRDNALQIKTHGGITFMGVSEYYAPESEKRDLKNYGGGFNFKCFFIFDFLRRNRLEFSLFSYTIWTYPDTTAFEKGRVRWLFLDAAYSCWLSERISLGVSSSLARERGTFSGYPDTRKLNRAVRLFAAWNL